MQRCMHHNGYTRLTATVKLTGKLAADRSPDTASDSIVRSAQLEDSDSHGDDSVESRPSSDCPSELSAAFRRRRLLPLPARSGRGDVSTRTKRCLIQRPAAELARGTSDWGGKPRLPRRDFS